jgi:ATP-binding cassette subfamily B protein
VPVVLISLASTGLSLIQPFLTKILVDRALVGRDLQALGAVVLAFLAVTALSFLLNVVSGLRYTRVSADILFDMRVDVFRHLQRLSPRYYAATPLGQIASRINSDIAEVQRVVTDVSLAWIGQVAYLIGSVVLLVTLDARLFAASLVAMPPALWALVRYRRRLEGAVRDVREQSAGIGTFLIEALQGMRLLAAHNAQQRAEHEFRRRNDGFVESLLALRRLTYLSGGMPGLLLALGGAVVFLVGGWRVIDGAITLGTLVAFGAYQVRLMGPVQGLMGIYASLATARVSLGRVQEILLAPPDVLDVATRSPADDIRGRVELRGVTHQFGRGVVLQGVSMVVEPGESVAIVGASGAGKSTLADLLTRMLDPDRGVVLLDDCDLKAWRLADVRRAVLVTDSEPFVWHASVAHNLRIAAEGAADQVLWHALELVQLASVVRAWPDGLATVVGERGRALSTGERQRLGLARAVLANPRVLVLDEATSGLDATTETQLLDHLAAWLGQRTVVYITHRAHVAARASRTIELNNGRVQLPSVSIT